MSDYLRQLLKDKLPQSTEIELHLFEFCNLSCAFCGQDHDSTEGMNLESLMEKADLVIDFMRDSPMSAHTVNLMGGEIFNDLVPDHLFDAYRAFHKKVYSWAQENEQTIRFNWVTNLIFTKSDRVESLIRDANNSYISTSYDFAGRGLTKKRMDPFTVNLERFQDRITVIGFVLTKQAIKALMTRIDPFFEYIYENFTLYFDYYVPELSADKMMPSEEQMRDALLYTARRYPNIYPVKDLLERDQNEMTCYSLNKLTLLPDNKEVKCRYMEYDDEDFVSEIDYSSNENIIEAHLDNNGCFGCPWYDRCSFRCFVQADWARLERMDECLFKSFFDIADGEGLLTHGSK